MEHKLIKLATISLTMILGVAVYAVVNRIRHNEKRVQPVKVVSETRPVVAINVPPATAAAPTFSHNHEAVFGAGKLKIVPASFELKSERLRYRVNVTYPRIVGSENLYVRKLNQHIKQLVTDQYQWMLNPSKADLRYYREKWPDVYNSVDLDYDITWANESFFSIYFESYTYGIGAAHTVQQSFSLNYDLTRRSELKLHHLFDNRSSYLEFLSSYCKSELSKKSDLLFDDVLKPQSRTFASWNLTREGIRFNFDACSVFGCASGEQRVVVPFCVVRRLLNGRWQQLELTSFQLSQCAQTSDPGTVLDYYHLLPDKYFEASKEQRDKWMLDPKRGAKVDIENGFIFAVGDGAQTSICMCILKRSGEAPLVSLKFHESDSDKYTQLDFLEYQHGSLTDVTQAVRPVQVNKECQCPF